VAALELGEIDLVVLQGVLVGRDGVSAMAQVEEGVGGIFEAAIEVPLLAEPSTVQGIERRLGVAQGGVGVRLRPAR
jgi:hypothetical protein